MKRAILSGISIVSVALALVLFAGVNYLGFRHYKHWDVGRNKRFALSPKTISVLKELKKDVSVYIVMEPATPAYEWAVGMLKRYKETSPRIKLKIVDPYKDMMEVKMLLDKFSVKDMGIVFASEKKSKFVPARELFDMDYSRAMMGGAPVASAFLGEAKFTSAILSLINTEQSTLYFTEGHGEKSLNDRKPGEGLAELKHIFEMDNFKVNKYLLANSNIKPKPNVDAIVIAGPKKAFLPEEVDKLRSMYKEGVRFFLMIDPIYNTALDKLFKDMGVEAKEEIIVDPIQNVVSPLNLYVNYYTLHPIVKPLTNTALVMPIVRPLEKIKGFKGKISPLVFSSKMSWGETDPKTKPYKFDKDKEKRGPLPIAMAIEDGAKRAVVVGDSDFVANMSLDNLGNRDFALAVVNWLCGNESSIKIGPKKITTVKLNIPSRQFKWLFWISVAIIPLAILAAGIVVVQIRKRW